MRMPSQNESHRRAFPVPDHTRQFRPLHDDVDSAATPPMLRWKINCPSVLAQCLASSRETLDSECCRSLEKNLLEVASLHGGQFEHPIAKALCEPLAAHGTAPVWPPGETSLGACLLYA
eukprot:4934594-Amphidinium_carterae.1